MSVWGCRGVVGALEGHRGYLMSSAKSALFIIKSDSEFRVSRSLSPVRMACAPLDSAAATTCISFGSRMSVSTVALAFSCGIISQTSSSRRIKALSHRYGTFRKLRSKSYSSSVISADSTISALSMQ